ncbi:MAG: helix-turn-helix transcriptional regulator [Bacillota bacterium]|jgi:transcriptional regulator with XRE-family HTH domain|nr:helix-turn-helix transcriptional regulator [Bacillota bacterium]HHW54909.1 helix-turn-helix transcriptional regulator [Bacillota bacterium]
MEFGEYLKKLREKRGFSIRKLALAAGVSNSYLSQIETGQRGIPSHRILWKLARPLKVDYEELLRAAGYLVLREGQYIFLEDNKYSSEPILDLEELLQLPRLRFKGVLLDEEEKEEFLEILEFSWKLFQKRKMRGRS